MQAVREKLSDISAMRKAKAEAKAEEKVEKEIARARVQMAHELRKAKEAEAKMDLHVDKAAQKAEEQIAKHSPSPPTHTEPQLTHAPISGTTDHHGHYDDNFADPILRKLQ
uniref:Late embryogenesis abundant protein 6-like n=1 Tax=Nelumbo nucifera TaxID=4432 RepID=A0A822XGK2_NELNU|nr:TPA_asm: hypothetical protein HUJ06_019609 [Nelumbo nucifera]